MARLLRAAAGAIAFVTAAVAASAQEPEKFSAGRFTVLAFPGDAGFAQTVLRVAASNDTFPWLPRPRASVVIALAPDNRRFREWAGVEFPEWGAAAAFPESQRIVMHGMNASGKAGDPLVVLRHELAHLALGEALGDLPPRWFDEGYASFAAGEWGRDEVLAANLALVLRGPKTFAALDSAFHGGETGATAAYALSYRAIAELAALDRERGLSLFFPRWKTEGSLDAAVRTSFGVTLDAFEARWRSNTRRRYGGLALVTDLAIVGSVFGVLVLPVYIGRRRREKERLERLRNREDFQEQQARESALDALLSDRDPDHDRRLLDTPKDQL